MATTPPATAGMPQRTAAPRGLAPVSVGPTVGAMFLLALSETLRVLIGNEHHGVDMTVYGALLILFIIFMPKGILGTILRR